jgi:hypothetical protein
MPAPRSLLVEDERLPYLLWDWLSLRKSPDKAWHEELGCVCGAGMPCECNSREEPDVSQAGRNTPLASPSQKTVRARLVKAMPISTSTAAPQVAKKVARSTLSASWHWP